jgi:hypothetical protein
MFEDAGKAALSGYEPAAKGLGLRNGDPKTIVAIRFIGNSKDTILQPFCMRKSHQDAGGTIQP